MENNNLIPVQFPYKESSIEFEFNSSNVMVNATQMASVFGRQVVAFMRNENTKSFVEACLKSENSHFLNVKSESDLIISKQKSGTWMHRVLALKFAAWLNPDFEVWVYSKIDQLLFGNIKARVSYLKSKTYYKTKIKEVSEKLSDNEDFKLYQEYQKKIKGTGADIRNVDNDYVNQQLPIWKEEFNEWDQSDEPLTK